MVELFSGTRLPLLLRRLKGAGFAGKRISDGGSWKQRPRGDFINGLSFWAGEEGQDIAEYAVMLAVILVVVVGTLRLIGSNTNNVFSSVASTLQ
jgi:Flp pilus assembly pilin Flp